MSPEGGGQLVAAGDPGLGLQGGQGLGGLHRDRRGLGSAGMKGLLKEELPSLHREGSDGETSDYQRSTPSPRDAEAMVRDLGEEGEAPEKGDCPPSPPSHWAVKALHPDLGFVDCSDSSSSSLASCPSPYSSQLDCRISNSLARLSSLAPRSSLLGKRLQVQLEKLPLREAKKPPLQLQGDRKRSLLYSASSGPHAGKKRKSQELVLSSSLFNSFRISKPKPVSAPPKKLEALNLACSHNEHRRRREEQELEELLQDDVDELDELGSTKTKTDIAAAKARTLPEEAARAVSESAQASVACVEAVTVAPPCAERDPTDSSFVLPRKLRFPASASGPASGITCKWQGCLLPFKTHGKLSDHIKVSHVARQLDSSTTQYSCLWEGCKVFGKPSSSRGWVEKHVPLHGGKFAFPCIVEGCRHRFSSQVMLERHVNSHFSLPSETRQSGPRKSTETGDTARKRLKRAGVRLKFRQLPFSARIFDFFDAGNMAGIRHGVAELAARSGGAGVEGDGVRLQGTVLGSRLQGDGGGRWLNVRWSPPDYLPDEWMPEAEFTPVRQVKLSLLPEAAKARVGAALLPRPERRKQGRKARRVLTNTDFLTPDEAAEEAE